MLAKLFLLALLVAASNSSPVSLDSSSVNYGEAVSMFLQAWKKMLPCGYAPDNIPVMAPLIDEFSSFEYIKGDTNIVGNVSNIRISGLNNFQVISGSYDSTTQRSTFDLIYPEIQILGSTEMEGTINILGFSFPMRQVSLLNERLEQLRFVGGYTFGPSLTNSNGIRISEFDLRFYLGDVKIDNWDTLLNISLNDYSNMWSSEFVSLFAKEIQPFVDELIAKHVLPKVNDALSGMNLTQLSNMFVTMANDWNKANCNVQA